VARIPVYFGSLRDLDRVLDHTIAYMNQKPHEIAYCRRALLAATHAEKKAGADGRRLSGASPVRKSVAGRPFGQSRLRDPDSCSRRPGGNPRLHCRS